MTINDLTVVRADTDIGYRFRVSYKGRLLAVIGLVPHTNKWEIVQATLYCVDTWADAERVGQLPWTEMLQAVIDLSFTKCL